MADQVFLPKWIDLVVALYVTPEEHRYCGRLHRKTNMTTRHLRDLIAQLEEKNIVERNESSKIKYLRLTAKGEQLARSFLEIIPCI